MKSLSLSSRMLRRGMVGFVFIFQNLCVYVCIFFVPEKKNSSPWAHKLLGMLGKIEVKLLGTLIIIKPQFRDVINHLTSI
jgi:hypothetical protein